MKLLVVLLAIFGYTYGRIEWNEIYNSDEKLPSKQSELDSNWAETEGGPQETLKITWYAKNKDPSLQLAFDQQKSLAGLRVAFEKDKVNKNFEDVYKKSGIFEEAKFLEKDYYYSTFLFTQLRLLKGKGRRYFEGDPIAEKAILKKTDYEELNRNVCDNKKKDFTEQGCHEDRGFIISLFKEDDKCDNLKPFYLIFNLQEDTGELVGFGWLAFVNDDDKSVTKTIKPEEYKVLFKNAPDCLTNVVDQGLKVVEVWMVPPGQRPEPNCNKVEKDEKGKPKFYESRCEKNKEKRGDGGEDF